MAGIGDLDEAAVGQPFDHLLGDLTGEDFAFFGPDHEGGALDVFEAFPEVGDFGDCAAPCRFVNGRVEAEDEVAAGLIECERGADLALKELPRLARVEGGVVFEGLGLGGEARRLARFAGGLADAAGAGLGHLRTHIGEHQVLQAMAVVARVGHRDAAADAVRDEVEGFEVHLLDEAAEVHGKRPDEVAAGRVLALAVAAKVRRVDAEVVAEAFGDVLPVAGVVHQPVEEDDRLALTRTPADVVVAQAVDGEVAIFAGVLGRCLSHRPSIRVPCHAAFAGGRVTSALRRVGRGRRRCLAGG